MEDRLLYRVPEVAVFLNISRSKVYELLGSGDLPSVNTPLGPRFRPAPISSYAAGRRQEKRWRESAKASGMPTR